MRTFKEFNEGKQEIKFDTTNVDTLEYESDPESQIRKNNKKRKTEEADRPERTLDEVLNVAGRRKRAMALKRNKRKLAVGRKKAQRRIANPEKLKGRARRQARNMLAKKLAKGVSKSELSPGRRAEIEKRLDRMGSRIDRNQKKLLPQVRKKEHSKKRGG